MPCQGRAPIQPDFLLGEGGLAALGSLGWGCVMRWDRMAVLHREPSSCFSALWGPAGQAWGGGAGSAATRGGGVRGPRPQPHCPVMWTKASLPGGPHFPLWNRESSGQLCAQGQLGRSSHEARWGAAWVAHLGMSRSGGDRQARWKARGQPSQQMSSPPSRHTAHSSSFF